MALVVLQVTIPLLGFYALDRIIKNKYTFQEVKKAGIISFLITGGFCLLCAVIPAIAGTFTSAADAGQPDVLVDTLIVDRMSLLSKDAWRSFWLIAVTCALLVWAYKTPKSDTEGKVRKGRMAIVAMAMIVLVWVDLFSAGKRYLNKEHFVTPKDFNAQYEPRPVDEVILEDQELDYRVLDLSVNTFNSSIPSYHHKTIGGYSPVKLQRYQDLIEKYITGEIRAVHKVIGESATVADVCRNLPYLPVTSMLNGKYIILGADYPPVENVYAFGNCWFVDSVVPASSPDEEIALLGSTDLRTAAVVGKDFIGGLPYIAEGNDSEGNGYIALTHYAPNELRYSYNTDHERLAIFSEIYYPKGWKAWIEPAGAYGKVQNGHYQPTENARKIDLVRADWMLRGAVIPEGEGQLIMRFEPDSYRIGKNISTATSIVLIMLLIASTAGIIIAKRKED